MTSGGGLPSGPGVRSGTARLTVAGLLALPLVELVVAIMVGRLIGAPLTVLLLILLSVLGVLVLRRSGGRAVRSLSAAGAVQPGSGPDLRAAADAGWVLLGGVLLVIPGFVTAVAGLFLVFGPTRSVLAPLLGRGAGRLATRIVGTPLVGRMTGAAVVQGEVVDVTVVDVDAPPQRTAPRHAPELTERPDPTHSDEDPRP